MAFGTRILLAGAAIAAASGAAALTPHIHDEPQVIAAASQSRMLVSTVNVELRYVQEGLEAVRVLLTPEERALSFFEARSAAEQAFLEAVGDRSLGDALKRITVVVRLAPRNAVAGDEQKYLFLHKGGKQWTILPGD